MHASQDQSPQKSPIQTHVVPPLELDLPNSIGGILVEAPHRAYGVADEVCRVLTVAEREELVEKIIAGELYERTHQQDLPENLGSFSPDLSYTVYDLLTTKSVHGVEMSKDRQQDLGSRFIQKRLQELPSLPESLAEVETLVWVADSLEVLDSTNQAFLDFGNSVFKNITGREFPESIDGKEAVTIVDLALRSRRVNESIGHYLDHCPPEGRNSEEVRAQRLSLAWEMLSQYSPELFPTNSFSFLMSPVAVAELQQEELIREVLKHRVLHAELDEKTPPHALEMELLLAYKPTFEPGEERDALESFLEDTFVKTPGVEHYRELMDQYEFTRESTLFHNVCQKLAVNRRLESLELLLQQMESDRTEVINFDQAIADAEQAYETALTSSLLTGRGGFELYYTRDYPQVLAHYRDHGLSFESIPFCPDQLRGRHCSVAMVGVKSELVHDAGKTYFFIRTGDTIGRVLHDDPQSDFSKELHARGFDRSIADDTRAHFKALFLDNEGEERKMTLMSKEDLTNEHFLLAAYLSGLPCHKDIPINVKVKNDRLRCRYLNGERFGATDAISA